LITNGTSAFIDGYDLEYEDSPLVAFPVNPVKIKISKVSGSIAATPARRFDPYECPTPTTVEN